MKTLSTFILFYLVFSLQAQWSHSPNPLTITAQINGGDNKLDIYFTNLKDTTYTIYWKVIKDSLTWKNGWETYICDTEFCYSPNIDKSAPSIPNKFNKGVHKVEFHFDPKNISGCTVIGYELYADKAFTQLVYKTSVNINGCLSSSTELDILASIKVYPNPATDYFQISNGTNINRVFIYNMFGKEVKSFYHYNNARHEIGDLKTGFYIVRMLDSNNKVVRSIKLSKNSLEP
ncbi:MAG: T9SS type A sorting domain-containing protein [Saprospiraceae bacterium]